MKRIKTIVALVLVAFALWGCQDLDPLKEKINDLESRVTALENVTKALNENIAALQAVASGQAISSVKEEDGVYTITLSNGNTLVLQQGNVGMGKAPIVSIDSEGYWMVDYQDGKGAQYVLTDLGAKIFAIGQNGVTPLFSVSEDGFWMISYDNGQKYNYVLDAEGNKVKAVAEGSGEDSYFAKVETTEDALILTLKNGEQYMAPIVGGFYFKISSPDEEVIFRLGEKKTFSVEKKGIANTLIVAPTGWEAYLSDLVLTVVAPSSLPAVTKSSLADTRKDVAVLAFSNGGHVTMSKIAVGIDGNVSVLDPAANIALVEATVDKLVFDVTLENSTSWYYMLREASASAPSPAELLSDGTKGTENRVSIEGLKGQTNYVLYVLPCSEQANGVVANLKARTADFANLYQAWQGGAEIKIGSKTYSKAVNGEAKLVTSQDQELWAAWFDNGTYGIIFIAEGATAKFGSAAFNKDVVVVGNVPGTRPVVRFTKPLASNNVDIVFKNVSLVMDDALGKAFDRPVSKRFIFEDCNIDLRYPMLERFSYNGVTGDMEGLELLSCDISVNWAADNTAKPFFMSVHAGGSKCGELIIKNNVVWSKEGKKEFHFVCSQYSGTNSFTNVVLENNTLYNVNNGPYSNGRSKALITQSSIESFTFNGNIAYDTAPVGKNDASRPHFCWMYSNGMSVDAMKQVTTNSTASLIDIAEYCTFNTGAGSEWGAYQQSLITWVAGSGNKEIESWVNPFESEDVAKGIFKTTSKYSSFGAVRD